MEASIKKNIGIVFPSSRYFGGTFQYALSIADCLIKYSNRFDYTIIYYNEDVPDHLTDSKGTNFVYIPSAKTPLVKRTSLTLNLALGKKIFNMEKAAETRLLNYTRLDLLVIPFPSLFGYRTGIPYIVSIPDMMYRYFPKLPEFPLKVRIRRDIEYKNAAMFSQITIADAGQGSDDIHKFLKIPLEKIRVIPYIPPSYIYTNRDMDLKTAEEILDKYGLPERFIFYPAQFWYHKNHIRLFRALESIKRNHNTVIPLVLSGSPQESYLKIIGSISELDLEQQVINLGYVNDKEVVALYKRSTALVFPTLFGPTNIPPLEAMVLGTPVACSNIFGMPEQIGGAGVLFDPYDIGDIAEKIYSIWTDTKLREKLIEEGRQKTDDLDPVKYAGEWESVILEALSGL